MSMKRSLVNDSRSRKIASSVLSKTTLNRAIMTLILISLLQVSVLPDLGKVEAKAVKSEAKGLSLLDKLIHPNANKSRIGDSYYQWSMAYPKDWTYGSLSYEEDMMGIWNAQETVAVIVDVRSWKDIESEFNLYKAPFKVPVEGKAMLLHLKDYVQQTAVINERIGKIGNLTFAEVIGTSDEGSYLMRMMNANGNRYLYRVHDSSVKQATQLSKHAALLNSFRPHYKHGKSLVTDVSTEEHGFRRVHVRERGMSFDVPSNWVVREDDLYIHDKVYNGQLESFVAKAEQGLTVQKLTEQKLAFLKKTYLPEHLQVLQEENIKLKNNITAKYVVTKHRYGKQWRIGYQVFVIEQGLKFHLAYNADETAQSRKEGERIVRSLQFTNNLKILSNVPTQTEWSADWQVTDKLHFASAGITVDIPKWWRELLTQSQYEDLKVTLKGSENKILASYKLPNSHFSLMLLTEKNTGAAKKAMEVYYKGSDSGIKFDTWKSTTFKGMPAYELSFKGASIFENDSSPYTSRLLLVEYRGRQVVIYSTMYDTARTPEMLEMMDRVMESVTFKK
ncbi:hypothetical protein [Paenibacillus sp. 481]|uniref:hypothetical protein n=1 Tax=Paenibacillus sp. 481 TaxID=2835869 RepID=UPI001E2FC6E0|nr:hypothetical protein [Paenibacillus sp. 481]UHA71643.1 hypothetical protein KIK04_12590 [Paenibacillus sp. 481]